MGFVYGSSGFSDVWSIYNQNEINAVKLPLHSIAPKTIGV